MARHLVATGRRFVGQTADYHSQYQTPSLKKLFFVVSLVLLVTCIGAALKYGGMRLSEPGQRLRLSLIGLGFAVSITGLFVTGL